MDPAAAIVRLVVTQQEITETVPRAMIAVVACAAIVPAVASIWE